MLAAVFVVLTAGCQVETELAIEASQDGDGRVRVTVELDEAATKEVPNLVRELWVDDVKQAGWAVEGPYPTGAGGAEIQATKRFRSEAEVAPILEELGGRDGPFQRFALDVDESTFRTRTDFRATVDLTRGLASFSDPVLAEKLGGEPLGVSPEELEERAGVPLDRAFVFRVVTSLPGRVQANTPSVAGNTATWTPRLGERVELVASAELNRPRPGVIALVAAGVALVGAALALGVIRPAVSRRRRRRRRQTPDAP